MKAGDKVTIRDGSYSLTLVDGKLKHTFINRHSIRGQHWEIVEVGCVLPSEKQSTRQRRGECLNDTIINGPDGVVFVHSKFLAPVDVSKKSKQEIRDMSEFKVSLGSAIFDTYYISDGERNYMHRDGEVIHDACEYFPTREQAQAVLDKFQPKHKWVHGDVFRNSAVTDMQIYLEHVDGPIVCVLKEAGRGGTPEIQLDNATFLFNIKDALSDRGLA